MHYSELNTPAPVALALDRHPELSWLAGWIKLGAIAGMTSVMLVMMLGQPRIFYAMSRATACCRRCSAACTRRTGRPTWAR